MLVIVAYAFLGHINDNISRKRKSKDERAFVVHNKERFKKNAPFLCTGGGKHPRQTQKKKRDLQQK